METVPFSTSAFLSCSDDQPTKRWSPPTKACRVSQMYPKNPPKNKFKDSFNYCHHDDKSARRLHFLKASLRVLSQPMDPEKKSLNFIFPTKYVIPKCLKFSHWPSKSQYVRLTPKKHDPEFTDFVKLNINQNASSYIYDDISPKQILKTHQHEVFPSKKRHLKTHCRHKYRRNDWTSYELPSWRRISMEGERGTTRTWVDMRDYEGM